MKIQGSEALLKSLIKEDVNTIFGYPGGAIMPIYDALYGYMDKINITTNIPLKLPKLQKLNKNSTTGLPKLKKVGSKPSSELPKLKLPKLKKINV